MSDGNPTRGRGSLGTEANNPAMDAGTSAKIQHTPNAPIDSQGDALHPGDFFSEVLYYPVTATGAKIARKAAEYTFGDEQGRLLLEMWLSGTAPDEVTMVDEDLWGDYMRGEPHLQEQIHKQLEHDAYLMRDRLKASPGRLEFNYEASFHGQVGKTGGTLKNGGYFTGYEILHGSKKTETLKDVQIIAKAVVEWKPKSRIAYTVTYRKPQFIWNDIINVNPKYKMDKILAGYSRWEKEYTSGGPQPKDFTVHIIWNAVEDMVIDVDTILPEFKPK
jgi:hypothetical protein